MGSGLQHATDNEMCSFHDINMGAAAFSEYHATIAGPQDEDAFSPLFQVLGGGGNDAEEWESLCSFGEPASPFSMQLYDDGRNSPVSPWCSPDNHDERRALEMSRKQPYDPSSGNMIQVRQCVQSLCW